MSTVLSRTTAAVRARYERSALAQYGAGLHTDCADCAPDPADVVVPAQRRHDATRDEQAQATL